MSFFPGGGWGGEASASEFSHLKSLNSKHF